MIDRRGTHERNPGTGRNQKSKEERGKQKADISPCATSLMTCRAGSNMFLSPVQMNRGSLLPSNNNNNNNISFARSGETIRLLVKR